MVQLIQLTIPGVPPSMNRFAGRENAWEYRAAKQKWTTAVQWAVRAAKAAPDRPYEHAKVTITYWFNNRNRHDADNYAGKLLLDGLTRAGLIVDDDLKHITTVIQGGYDKGRPRTEITVEEVTEAPSSGPLGHLPPAGGKALGAGGYDKGRPRTEITVEELP